VFIDSGFASPVPAFPFPVALVNRDPDENPMVTVCFNRDWLPYVVTCLYQLTLQATWQTDDPDALNLVQARAMTLISNFIQGCNPPLPNAVPGADGGDEFMLRQNPDNPCELQTSVDGVHWCTWADLSLCKPAVQQPGSGSEQPPPNGGQACYNAVMNASEQWNVPTVVNAGDQITFSNATGAGADGGIDGLWYCPNGQTFFAGACVGVPGTKSADIANTIPHMRLIVNVGGTWYDAYNTSFTVPGGVANSPVIVQINDSTISDNSGSYRFDVCVTNNETGTWSHTFDFTTSDHGFVAAAGGVYSPGVGWIADDRYVDSNPQYYRMVQIAKSLPARTITSYGMKYDLTKGSYATAFLEALILADSGAFPRDFVANPAASNGTGLTYQDTGTHASITSLVFRVCSSVATTATYSGSATITSVTVTGTGTDPF